MFACLQCTVCILNASSPCAPRVKKIRPIVGLLVVSVDTLRLEEASINIDPSYFDAYISIFAREFEIVRVVLIHTQDVILMVDGSICLTLYSPELFSLSLSLYFCRKSGED